MQRFGKEEERALLRVIRSADKTLSYYSFSYLGEGGEVYKFEREFAQWLGRKYCVAVNSGTSALFVAIRAITNGMPHRDIILPAYTFVADAEAVLATANIPVFFDIDPKDYCMQQFGFLASNVAIPVHTLGNVCPPERFQIFANTEHAIGTSYSTIEDCAQCVGGKWKGKKAGTFGDIAIFSCQGTKSLTTGEGGLICMDDKELYERCCAIRNHGDYYRNTNFVGYNFRMTELQAAIGRCQLTKVNKFLLSFKKNAELIFDLLPKESHGYAGIEPPYIPTEVDHAYFILGCKFPHSPIIRDKFLKRLHNARMKAGLLWNKSKPDIPGSNQPPGNIISAGYRMPLYDIPLYRKYKCECPNTESVIAHSLWVDIHRFTSEARIQREMALFRKIYKEIV